MQVARPHCPCRVQLIPQRKFVGEALNNDTGGVLGDGKRHQDRGYLVAASLNCSAEFAFTVLPQYLEVTQSLFTVNDFVHLILRNDTCRSGFENVRLLDAKYDVSIRAASNGS